MVMALGYAGTGCTQIAERPAAPEGIAHAQPSIPPIGEDASDITAFTENASVRKGDSYGLLVLKGSSTSLNMSGGSIHKLIVKDASQVSIQGGVVQEMYLYDTCSLVITGGKIDTVSGYGHNAITVKGRAQIGKVQGYGAPKLVVDGADARVDTIQYFTKCGCVDQSQKVRIDLSGGTFNTIGTGSTEVALNVTGYDLRKSAYGGKHGYGLVKGKWKDGTSFSFDLADKSTFSHTDLHGLQLPFGH